MHKDTVVLKAVNWHGQLIAGQGCGCLISLLARSKLSFQGCQGIKHGEWVIVSKSEVIVLNKAQAQGGTVTWHHGQLIADPGCRDCVRKAVEATTKRHCWQIDLLDQ
ncbi:hypothetical protein Peur_022021 [Populus x canadensis]